MTGRWNADLVAKLEAERAVLTRPPSWELQGPAGKADLAELVYEVAGDSATPRKPARSRRGLRAVSGAATPRKTSERPRKTTKTTERAQPGR